MLFLRALSGLFLLAATLALIAAATRVQLGTPDALFAPFLSQIAQSSPGLIQTMEKSISGIHPLLWDPIVKSFLRLPAWVSLGAIGIILGWLGRRRRQRINVFTN
ncbi:MAG: hypothetical protein DIU63_05600 [Proteobacteria bacterium]|jgi:hypothetical protein|nr:MAG: hypothetical protein DIU63_05600 [Pseudomonadota bacterium]